MKLIAKSEQDMPRIGKAPEEWQRSLSAPMFEVSSLGRVRSISRWVPCRGGIRKIAAKERRLVKVKATGYLKVGIGRRGEWLVHRLVAEVFCEMAREGLQVNHKNGDRADNRAENLEWVTSAENIKHAYRQLGRKGSAKGKFGAEHGTSKAVIARHLVTGEVREFGCASDAVRAIGADSGGISRCCAGKIKSHRGYSWKFAT